MFRFSAFIIFFTLVFVTIIAIMPEGEYVVLNLADIIIEINAVFLAFLLLLFIALILFVAKLIYELVDLPKNLQYRALKNNQQKLIQEVETALVSLQLGNVSLARKQIAKLKSTHQAKLLPHILEAQAALLEKDDKKLQIILDKILHIDANNSFALNGKGALSFKQKNYQESQKFLAKAFAANPKAKNILPALISSYFINDEQEKLEKLLKEAKNLLPKGEYVKETALNNFLLATQYFKAEKYELGRKYIAKAYKLYSGYFPIFKLYIAFLLQENNHAKARRLIVKHWPLYNDSELIFLYEESVQDIAAKKQFVQIAKLIAKNKSDNFLPVLLARIAIKLNDEKLQKEAEISLSDSPSAYQFKIAKQASLKLKELLYGVASHEAEEARKILNEDLARSNYICTNCDHILTVRKHICPNCLELASFTETTISLAENKKLISALS